MLGFDPFARSRRARREALETEVQNRIGPIVNIADLPDFQLRQMIGMPDWPPYDCTTPTERQKPMTTFSFTTPVPEVASPRFAIGAQTGSLYLVLPEIPPVGVIIVGQGGLEGKEGHRQVIDGRDKILPPGAIIKITV